MIPFSRDGDGVSARLTPTEAAILANLAEQLIGLLEDRAAESPADLLFAQIGIGGPADAPLDPALARLLPDAYRGDQEAASEHRQLTELSLVERKLANARAVRESLDSAVVRLDPSGVQSWLRTLTDLRLTIAARLQIETDDDVGTGDPTMLSVYDWLGYLQGTLVEVIDE